jgi:hypothetical protein
MSHNQVLGFPFLEELQAELRRFVEFRRDHYAGLRSGRGRHATKAGWLTEVGRLHQAYGGNLMRTPRHQRRKG